MKISLTTKPTLPMIAKPMAHEVAILMNSVLRRKCTLFVGLGAAMDECSAVVVEVYQIGLCALNVL